MQCTLGKQYRGIYTILFEHTLFTKLMLATLVDHHKGCRWNWFEKTFKHGFSVMEDLCFVGGCVTCWTKKLMSERNTVQAPDNSISNPALLTVMLCYTLCSQVGIQQLWHCSSEFFVTVYLSSGPLRHAGCLHFC